MNFFKFFLLSLAISPAALANDALKLDISRLAGQIREMAPETKASDEALAGAKRKLEEIRALLAGEGGDGEFNGECYKFAYETYYRSMSSQEAADRAAAGCRNARDASVVKYLYEIYYRGLSSKDALDRTFKVSGRGLEGNLETLKFSFEKFYSGLASTEAADRAAIGVSKLPRRGAKSCVTQLFESYYRSMGTVDAITKALEGCKRNPNG